MYLLDFTLSLIVISKNKDWFPSAAYTKNFNKIFVMNSLLRYYKPKKVENARFKN